MQTNDNRRRPEWQKTEDGYFVILVIWSRNE